MRVTPPCDVQVAATPAMEEAAVEACKGILDSIEEADLTPEDVASLLAVCAPALSSIQVANRFVSTVTSICSHRMDNRVICGAAGVVPLVVSAVSAHGAVSAEVAGNGCNALGWLCPQNTLNIDRVVLQSGGLDVICDTMELYADKEDVQRITCASVRDLATGAGPAALAALRGSRVMKLLQEARVRHPKGGGCSVADWAGQAMAALAPKDSPM